MQSIKSHGLDNLEREILTKQIRTISGRLNQHWEFQGEGKDADLVFAKTVVEVPASAILVLVSNEPGNYNGPTLEYPIRVMQLATLLQQFGSQTTTASKRVIELINKKNVTNFVVPCNLGLVGFRPRDGKICTRQRSIDNLIKNLGSTPPEKLDIKFAKAEPKDFTWEFTTSAKQVIWQLAKLEGQQVEPHFNDAASYKLSSWPRVTEWEPNPISFKLATLFSKQYLTVQQAAKVCKITESQVKVFLACCQACGVKILSAVSTQPKATPKRYVAKDKQSLGWLRSKIKTYFNYGN